jgi:hypothetical protein
MIINAYEYLFYKLYQWSIKVNGKDYYNKASACFMISTVLIFNIITVLVIMDLLTELGPPNIPKLVGGLFALACWILNYAYFSSGGRYQAIIDRYKNEGSYIAKRGNIIVSIYVIGSFVLMGVSGFLGVYINQLRQGM